MSFIVINVASGAVETDVPFVVAFWAPASWRAALERDWKEASSAGSEKPESSTKEKGEGSERLALGMECRQGRAVGVGEASLRFSGGAGAVVDAAAVEGEGVDDGTVIEAAAVEEVRDVGGAEEDAALLDSCAASDD